MKKKILYVALIVICLSIITGGTLAYFSVADVARNVITAGTVDFSIVEQQMMTDGGLVPYPNEPIDIMPGTSVSKIVSVRSESEPAWVRMTYTVTVFNAAGEEMDIPREELEKVIIIEPDGSGWTKNGSWWYYEKAIKSGEETTPLFDSVSFSGPNMGNEYQNCKVYVDVIVQAVQQAHNGNSVMEAVWPQD